MIQNFALRWPCHMNVEAGFTNGVAHTLMHSQINQSFNETRQWLKRISLHDIILTTMRVMI